MLKATVKYLGIIAAAMLLMPCAPAEAVVQKMSQAMRYEMMVAADGSQALAKAAKAANGEAQEIDEANIEYDIPVNYNRIIAETLLHKANSNVNINAEEKKRTVSVPLGKELKINLIEEESQVCTYECNDKILKYSAGSKEDTNLTIVFNAENPGRTKLYVDCVTNTGGDIKVESKVFNITVD